MNQKSPLWASSTACSSLLLWVKIGCRPQRHETLLGWERSFLSSGTERHIYRPHKKYVVYPASLAIFCTSSQYFKLVFIASPERLGKPGGGRFQGWVKYWVAVLCWAAAFLGYETGVKPQLSTACQVLCVFMTRCMSVLHCPAPKFTGCIED